MNEQQARWFGGWLRDQRIARGLSIEEAKAKADMSRDAWTSLELGGRTKDGEWIVPNPRPQTLMAVADTLNLPAADVFKRAGLKPPVSVLVATDQVGEDVLAQLVDQLAFLVEEVRVNRAEIAELQERLGTASELGEFVPLPEEPSSPRRRRTKPAAP
jgi:transcriptional regulator with XRE-family HTH domain